VSRVDVTTEIVIQRPRDVVAEFAADPDNATVWYQNIKSVEWRSPKPAVGGSKIAFVARFLGRTLSYVYDVRESVPGQRLVMSTSDGPFAMETTYTWRDEPGGGTKMTLRNRGEPSGVRCNCGAAHGQRDATRQRSRPEAAEDGPRNATLGLPRLVIGPQRAVPADRR
jgi:hypothetical protein